MDLSSVFGLIQTALELGLICSVTVLALYLSDTLLIVCGLSRVYPKTPNAPGQWVFLRCTAAFSLEIRQYSCEKMSCSTQKFLAAGHIGSWKNTP